MKALVKFGCGIAVALIFTAVQASAVVYFSDTFSYADGQLTNTSGGVWTSFSGSSSLNVSNGYAIVAQDRTLDVAASLGGVHSNDIIYAKYDFRFDVLPGPTNGTSYFSMFKDSGTSLFLGRTLGGTVSGDPAGTYHLGANAEASSQLKAFFPTALSTGVWFTAVLRINQTAVSAPVVTIWVNPTLESDPSASHTGTLPNLAISTFALRQATVIGRINIDNLVIASSFAEAIPEPSTMVMVGAGLLGLLAIRRRRS